MSDISLVARSPLDGFETHDNGAALTEVVGKAIIAIAAPLGGRKKLSEAIAAIYQTNLPIVGQSTESPVDNAKFLGMARNQYFLLFDHEAPGALKIVTDRVGNVSYLSDQSDSWAIVRLSGPNCREALSRICALDLEFSVFPEGSCARTIMEHHGTLIYHESTNNFLLFSARSSARSFLNVLQTAVSSGF